MKITRRQITRVSVALLVLGIAAWAINHAVGEAATQPDSGFKFPDDQTKQEAQRHLKLLGQVSDAFPGQVDIYMDKDFDLKKPSLAGVKITAAYEVGNSTYLYVVMPDKVVILIDKARVVAVKLRG